MLTGIRQSRPLVPSLSSFPTCYPPLVTLRQLLPGVDPWTRFWMYCTAVHRGAVARRVHADPRRSAIVRLRMTGHAVAVTLPKHLLRALGWRRADHVLIELADDGRSLTVRHVGRF